MGAVAKIKTTANDLSVEAYLEAIEDETRREDCRTLVAMMRKATRQEPTMWGTAIVGFGSYHYRYESGREGDMPLVGFASRKRDLTIYIVPGFAGYQALLAKLGKHSTAKVCLYLKRLADVDSRVLDEIIRESVKEVKRRHPA